MATLHIAASIASSKTAGVEPTLSLATAWRVHTRAVQFIFNLQAIGIITHTSLVQAKKPISVFVQLSLGSFGQPAQIKQ